MRAPLVMTAITGRFWAPLLCGALAGLGQAPINWGVITLVGFVCAYHLFQAATDANSALRLGWVFGLGYFAVSLHWIVEPFLVDVAATGWMAPFALFFLAAGLAVFWAAAGWLAFRLGRDVVLWACCMALAELARAYVFTGFPWAMPSYAWINSPIVLGAAWIGPHGLNTVLFLAAGGLAVFLGTPLRRPRLWVLLIPITLSFAPAPRLEMPQDGPTIRLVQPNAPQHQKWDRDFVEVFYQRQLDFTAQAGDPNFVIWPESAVVDPIPYADGRLREMASLAGNAQVVTGIQRIDGALSYNSLVTLSPTGDVEQIYDKRHLVPFGEYIPLGSWLSGLGLKGLAASDGAGFARGIGPHAIALDGIGAVLPLICYEVVFPQNMRSTTRPRLLLQLTNDAWFGEFSGPYQHLAQARMRAIETGVPMIRVANTGVSAVIDARGRVVASIPLGQAGYLDTKLPSERPETLYAKLGDRPFGAIIVVLTLLAVLRARRKTVDGSVRQT